MKVRTKKKMMKSIRKVVMALNSTSRLDDRFAIMLSGEAGYKDIRVKYPKNAYRWDALASKNLFRSGAWFFLEGKTQFKPCYGNKSYERIYYNWSKTVWFILPKGVDLSVIANNPEYKTPDIKTSACVIVIDMSRFVKDVDYVNNIGATNDFGKFLVNRLYESIGM